MCLVYHDYEYDSKNKCADADHDLCLSYSISNHCTNNYIFEILKPEPMVHSGCLFLYKISDNLNLHLKFGPHIYEKVLNENINLSVKHKNLNTIKNILSISPLQYLLYIKRIIRKLIRK